MPITRRGFFGAAAGAVAALVGVRGKAEEPIVTAEQLMDPGFDLEQSIADFAHDAFQRMDEEWAKHALHGDGVHCEVQTLTTSTGKFEVYVPVDKEK